MVVIDLVKIRKRIAWLGWRLRYWALWKYRQWVLLAVVLAVLLATTTGIVKLLLVYNQPMPQGVPRQAYEALIWYIVILIISMVISYAMRPKPTEPDAVTKDAPRVKDGAAVCRVYGTVWFDDAIVLGWRQEGVTAIEKDGGKK
jgi:hypothetical protein